MHARNESIRHVTSKQRAASSDDISTSRRLVGVGTKCSFQGTMRSFLALDLVWTRACGSTLRQLSALRSQVLRRGKRCWSAGVETRKEVLRQVLRRTLKFFAACGAKNVCGKHFLVRSKPLNKVEQKSWAVIAAMLAKMPTGAW